MFRIQLSRARPQGGCSISMRSGAAEGRRVNCRLINLLYSNNIQRIARSHPRLSRSQDPSKQSFGTASKRSGRWSQKLDVPGPVETIFWDSLQEVWPVVAEAGRTNRALEISEPTVTPSSPATCKNSEEKLNENSRVTAGETKKTGKFTNLPALTWRNDRAYLLRRR